MKFKKKIFNFVENNKIFNYTIITLVIINIFAIILQSVKNINLQFEKVFYIIESLSVFIFSIEYCLRVYSSTEKYQHRFQYILRPMAIIDLLAILPFFLPFLGLDLRFIRIFRIFRIFRIAKLIRYVSVLDLFKRVIIKEKDSLILTSMIMIVSIILSSVFIFYAENKAQPELFSSIPAAMWWSVVSLTTMGYGDMYPITLFGKFIASLMALIGIALIAMPTGIISAGFISEINKNKKIKCPYCNNKF